MSKPLTDIASEEILAGLLLSDPTRLDDDRISPEYLSNPEVKSLVRHAFSLRITGREVNPVNLGIESGDSKIELLANKLTSGALPVGDFRTVRDHLANLGMKRRAAALCKKYHEMAHDPDTDASLLVSEIERNCLSIRQDKHEGLKDGSDMRDVLDELIWRSDNPGQVKGIRFGCPKSEKLLGGLQGGQTYVIAARPSVGKTGLMTTMILNMIMQGLKPCVFSLEMKGLLIKSRVLASLSGVPLSITNSRPYSEMELRKIHRAIDDLRKWPWKYSERARMDIDDIVSQTRRNHAKEGVDALFVDYLQIVKNRAYDKGDRRISIGDSSARLKALSEELNIPIIFLAQLKRKDGYFDRDRQRTVHAPPELEDLKESGDIEQDADVVGLIERDQKNNAREASIMWAKNRNGPTGKVHFEFKPETTTFVEAQTQEEPF